MIRSVLKPVVFYTAPVYEIESSKHKWGIVAKYMGIVAFLPERFDTQEEAEKFIEDEIE